MTHEESQEVPGDDVPEYPGEGGDRDPWIKDPKHRNIEDLDDDELT